MINLHTDESATWSNVDGKTVRTDTPGHAMIRTADMVNGKAKIDLNVAEFANFLPHKTSSWYAQILATVEEEFTGVQLNETGGVQLYPYRYEMSCTDYSKCYSFFVDKENEIIFKITLVDGTVLKDTKTPVKVRARERKRETSIINSLFKHHHRSSSLRVFAILTTAMRRSCPRLKRRS